MALVGCGMMAEHHIRAVGSGCVEWVALVDTSCERTAAVAKVIADVGAGDAVAFGTLAEALAGIKFDAVAVMLPHDLHERYALEVLEAEKHLFLEKPLAHNLDSSRRILEAAEVARELKGLVTYVAENSSFWPEVVACKETIASGEIGALLSGAAHYYECLKTSVMERSGDGLAGWLGWRKDKARAGGGVLVDGGQHWIRPLREWFGEIDSVVAVTSRPLPEMEGESAAKSLIQFRSGITATYSATVLGADGNLGTEEPWFRVIGSRGEITINASFDGGGTVITEACPEGRPLIREGQPSGYMAALGPQIENFVGAILSGTALARGPGRALGDLLTAHAMYRSAESRSWEKVWDTSTEKWSCRDW